MGLTDGGDGGDWGVVSLEGRGLRGLGGGAGLGIRWCPVLRKYLMRQLPCEKVTLGQAASHGPMGLGKH